MGSSDSLPARPPFRCGLIGSRLSSLRGQGRVSQVPLISFPACSSCYPGEIIRRFPLLISDNAGFLDEIGSRLSQFIIYEATSGFTRVTTRRFALYPKRYVVRQLGNFRFLLIAASCYTAVRFYRGLRFQQTRFQQFSTWHTFRIKYFMRN